MHDDVIKWKHFRVIGPSPVISPHKGQWRGALFFFICTWINGCVNNREAGHAYDASVMWYIIWKQIICRFTNVELWTSKAFLFAGMYNAISYASQAEWNMTMRPVALDEEWSHHLSLGDKNLHTCIKRLPCIRPSPHWLLPAGVRSHYL